MKVTISDDCTGCGVCETIAPDVFVVEDEKATVNAVARAMLRVAPGEPFVKLDNILVDTTLQRVFT